MTIQTTSRAALAALTLTLGLTGNAVAEAYQLDFDAPRGVGDTFQMRGSASTMQEVFTRVNGQTVNEEATHGEAFINAKCEVLAINDNGGASQIAFELIEYEFELNSEALELDTTRRLVVTAHDGELTFAYEGGDTVGQGYEEVLALLLDMPIDVDGDGGDTNIMMNALEPRSVGDEWEMNHEYMAQELNDDGALALDPNDINSRVKLLSVQENAAGARMATLESEATASNLDMGEGQLPPFMQVTDSRLRMIVNGELPLDRGTSYGLQHAQMEMALIAKGKSPDGQVIEIEAEFERESEVTYTPVQD